MKRDRAVGGKAIMSYLSDLTLYITNHSSVDHSEYNELFSSLYRQMAFPILEFNKEKRAELGFEGCGRYLFADC